MPPIVNARHLAFPLSIQNFNFVDKWGLALFIDCCNICNDISCLNFGNCQEEYWKKCIFFHWVRDNILDLNKQEKTHFFTELNKETKDMRPNENVEIFPGNVKYGGSSGCIGSMKWKSGALVIDKDDRSGWKIKMKLDCSESFIINYPVSFSQTKIYLNWMFVF